MWQRRSANRLALPVFAHQIEYISLQNGGQLAQNKQGRISRTTLNLTDVGSVQLRAQGERFLRQALLAPAVTEN